MMSSDKALAQLKLDDGAMTSDDPSNLQNQVPKDADPPDAEILLAAGPETSVFMEDGLFVRIASFCQGRELLRLCTLAKSDLERKCELVLMNGGIKKDPRICLENLSDENSWASVRLRQRIALDMDLVFTIGDSFVMEHLSVARQLEEQGRAYPNRVYFAWPTTDKVARTQPWSGAICGRKEQAMIKGVHKAIFTTSLLDCRLGILGEFALRGNLIRKQYQLANTEHVREYDTYERAKSTTTHTDTGLTAALAASHNVSSTTQVGLEIDIDKRTMRIYRSSNFKTEKARYVGSVMIRHPSPEGYFWAVYSSKYADGECSIERVSGDMTFHSYYRPGSASTATPLVDANMVRARQPTSRFHSSTTRLYFDPYLSPPPSP